MKYILDSSVALKWVLPEPDFAPADQVRNERRDGSVELIAPDIFPIEIGHAITKAERQSRILPSQGWPLWEAVMADCPALVPSIPLMPRAYAISSQLRIGIYDCLYAALAEAQQCELLTADIKMANSLKGRFARVALLSSLL